MVYLDDIILSVPDNGTHLSRLREVCKRLSSCSFTGEQEKCEFFAKKLSHLGFIIDKDGLPACESKVKAFVDALVSQNVTQVKAIVEKSGPQNVTQVKSIVEKSVPQNVTKVKAIVEAPVLRVLLMLKPLLA